MDYSQFFSSALNRLHDERRYRVFADLGRIAGRFPHALWHSPKGARNIVIWRSNDYLGMGQHPKVVGGFRIGAGEFLHEGGKDIRWQAAWHKSFSELDADDA